MQILKHFLICLFALILTTSCSQNQKAKSQDGYIVSIPKRAYWNSNVTVTLLANPGTICTLRYIDPTGNLSESEGLGQTIGNENNLCLWRWKIGKTDGKGTGRLIFTINEVSETHFIEVWPTE